jgi:hypothetical protein
MMSEVRTNGNRAVGAVTPNSCSSKILSTCRLTERKAAGESHPECSAAAEFEWKLNVSSNSLTVERYVA